MAGLPNKTVTRHSMIPSGSIKSEDVRFVEQNLNIKATLDDQLLDIEFQLLHITGDSVQVHHAEYMFWDMIKRFKMESYPWIVYRYIGDVLVPPNCEDQFNLYVYLINEERTGAIKTETGTGVHLTHGGLLIIAGEPSKIHEAEIMVCDVVNCVSFYSRLGFRLAPQLSLYLITTDRQPITWTSDVAPMLSGSITPHNRPFSQPNTTAVPPSSATSSGLGQMTDAGLGQSQNVGVAKCNICNNYYICDICPHNRL